MSRRKTTLAVAYLRTSSHERGQDSDKRQREATPSTVTVPPFSLR
jgi:hypothetical protein